MQTAKPEAFHGGGKRDRTRGGSGAGPGGQGGGKGGGVDQGPGGLLAQANLIEGHEALFSCDEPDSMEEAVVVPHGQPGAQRLQGIQPNCRRHTYTQL